MVKKTKVSWRNLCRSVRLPVNILGGFNSVFLIVAVLTVSAISWVRLKLMNELLVSRFRSWNASTNPLRESSVLEVKVSWSVFSWFRLTQQQGAGVGPS